MDGSIVPYTPPALTTDSNSHRCRPHQDVVVWLRRDRPGSSCRRHCLTCSAAFIVFFLLLAGAVYLLYPSDSEIRIARIGLHQIKIRTDPTPTFYISFSITVRVRNWDFFSLSYDFLAISIGYRGRQLGHVAASGGRIRARGSSYVEATLTVDGFEVIYGAFYLIMDLAKGLIPFDTETCVEGELGIFFIDVPLKATMSCEVDVNVSEQTISFKGVKYRELVRGVYLQRLQYSSQQGSQETVSCKVDVNVSEQTIVRQNCYPESLADPLGAHIGAEDT